METRRVARTVIPPIWGFVGFIIVIFAVAVVVVSFLVLKGNGTL